MVPLKSTAIANDFGQSFFLLFTYIFFVLLFQGQDLCAPMSILVYCLNSERRQLLASSFASNSFLSKDFKIYILVEYFWYFTPFANQVSCSRLRYWLL